MLEHLRWNRIVLGRHFPQLADPIKKALPACLRSFGDHVFTPSVCGQECAQRACESVR
jgi:hypothetical protein